MAQFCRKVNISSKLGSVYGKCPTYGKSPKHGKRLQNYHIYEVPLENYPILSCYPKWPDEESATAGGIMVAWPQLSIVHGM